MAYIGRHVKNLTKSDISIGIDGEKWIFRHRQKTETASKIPIFPIPQMIIDNYENHPECCNQNKLLPILSNQRMNAYLKEIVEANQLMAEIQNHKKRMPVILHPEDENRWLDQVTIKEFAFPYTVNLIFTKTPPNTGVLSLFQ